MDTNKDQRDPEEPVRVGIQPAVLGYLSLLVVPAVAWGAGRILDLLFW